MDITILLDAISTSFWLPVSANIMWTKHVSLQKRILSFIMMSLAYICIYIRDNTFSSVMILWPILFLITYFCFNKDINSFILVPGAYMIGVVANYAIAIIFYFIKVDAHADNVLYFVRLFLITVLIVVLSYLVNRLYLKYTKAIEYIPSKNITIAMTVIITIVSLFYWFMVFHAKSLGDETITPIIYFVFYLAQAALIVLIFHFITFNIYSTQKTKREEESKRNLLEYTSQVENMYDELRSFKHDYVNVLLTLSSFIDNDDMDGLNAYFKSTVLPTSEKLNHSKYYLHKLSKIKEPAIKGMLSAKFINAMNLGINLFVDIMDDIPEISMSVLDLTRILGIYIDNAVEAALETESKEIKFNVVLGQSSVAIIVANSFINKGISLSEIEKNGISTKGEGRGIGLCNVRKILESYENVSKMTEINNNYFSQTLVIEKMTA